MSRRCRTLTPEPTQNMTSFVDVIVPAPGRRPPIDDVPYALITSPPSRHHFQLVTSSSYDVVDDDNTTLNVTSFGVCGSSGGSDNMAAKVIVLGTIMASAVLGNLLVVVSVLRYDRLRRVANSFIVSLAFADLLVAVLVMPFNASQVCVA